VPKFITDGTWHRYVAEGHTLVPIDFIPAANLRWAIAGGAGFAIPGGFTLVPRNPPEDMTGVFNLDRRPTESLLITIAWNVPAPVGPSERQQAVDDLRWLRADAVVMPQSIPSSAIVAPKISDLLGVPAERVSDVYVWRVDRH
jgi:hypothetical protein